ncbi:hypothetical protein AMK59_738 [Oryctes borbonicus]|uniref:Uncharacterized protein n=1 Tax=Oryctes borbonicus TaxID=1629725 RepID=A0A0T6B9F4_9SCAR|nr:hypothetical protein AMK59_738 [Oryctes borbonicus]
MKDIIHTRNSVKKRNRLSGKSDDFRPEDLVISDEEVFESKYSKSPTSFSKNGSTEETVQTPLPSIDRYQTSVEDHVCIDQEIPPKLELHNKLQDEIQKNYKDLQTKLSLEFQEKMREWEKMKHFSSNSATSSGAVATGFNLSPEELKEQAFKKKMEEWEKIKGHPKHNMQLQSEEHLPLEFRKKLQEWQRIKKGLVKEDAPSNSNSQKKKLGEWPKWKSVSVQRTDVSPTEQQPLSEDFIRKLEAWKQIKSHSYSASEEDKRGNKTPSPKLCRKDGGSSRQSKKVKEQTEKELQWFEKELTKIEREKQRLERERQKFLEREERLTKLRKSVMADNKQNILVQTPSGFYRFEGISRKFTQKLYEWEKAQGIAPEASTFALLSNCYVPTINSNGKYELQSRLVKSKSADSVMNSDLNLTHPLLSQQPSSLSLNDVDNLENELNKAASSEPELLTATAVLDDDEPEAVIVEVEDIIEETAAPLFSFVEKKHTPVYQQQETSCNW